MTPLETLVLVLGIPFFFIEISQLIQLVRSQKKLTSIWERVLENPQYAGAVVNNAVQGYIAAFNESEEVRTQFFGFIQNCAVSGAVAIKAWANGPDGVTDDAAKKQALKAVPKPIRGLVQTMDILGIDVKSMAKKKAHAQVDNVIEGW